MVTRRIGGFTLIELIVTIAIVGILARVAFGAYTSQITKANRRNVQAQMLDIANREQQYLLMNRTYAAFDSSTTTSALQASTGYALPADVSSKYTVTVAVGGSTPPSYTITATPKSGSDGALTLDSAGTKLPASKW